MLKNYLTTAFRNQSKNRLFALLNITGLAVGLAATLFIGRYIGHELSFDRFHRDGERIFRVGLLAQRGDATESDSPVFTAPLAPALREEFPEIGQFARVSDAQSAVFSFGDRLARTEQFAYADSTFFEVFSFRLISGETRTVLAAPFSVVLTEKLAAQLFPGENPIGKTLRLDNETTLTVAGVAAAPPPNSHLQFDALASFSTLYRDPENFMGWDGGNRYLHFLKLRPGAEAEKLEAKLPTFFWKNINEGLSKIGFQYRAYLQPLGEIRLWHSDESPALRRNLWVFGLVGLLVFGMACANFVNLSLAASLGRVREVGVRKALGAGRGALVRQFLTETLLLAALALVPALILLKIALPFAENLSGQTLADDSVLNLPTLALAGAGLLATGLLAGLYPAWFLSGARTAEAVKGRGPNSRPTLRKALIITQFAISTTLMVCTFGIARQMDFLKKKHLGFEKENRVLLPLVGAEVQEKYATLRQVFGSVAGVEQVSGSSQIPGEGLTSNGYFPEGKTEPFQIKVLDVDENFIKTYGLDLLQGRNFRGGSTSPDEGILVNEAFLRQFNWPTGEALGKTVRRNGQQSVVGVVRDFHFDKLQNAIAPCIFTNRPWMNRFDYLTVKIAPGKLPETLDGLRSAWKTVVPAAAFDYAFLDERLTRLYRAEERFQRLFNAATGLAFFVGLLGIFGLSAFAAERRRKEIGIRKVLGATVAGISNLLVRDFVKLVVAAIFIASPIAFYFMKNWLNDFAYRIEIEWWMFVGAGILAVAVACLTVGFQAVRAALANPVKSLRSE